MSQPKLRARLQGLPFVSILDPKLHNGLHMDMWSVQPIGDWAANNALGRLYAQEMLAVMKLTGSPHLLSQVARAQIVGHTDSGLETGFAHFFAEAALKS